jgi:hypothetical protein
VNIQVKDSTRRGPRFAIVLVALVCFGFVELAPISPAMAQSNVPAGTLLVPASVGPLSSGPAASSGSTSSGLTRVSPLAPPPVVPAAAAPGAPAALATTSALPVLNPAPAVVAGGYLAVPQSIFTCSCFGTGLGTRWVGKVQSTNFQSATNAAAAQCNSYASNSGTLSPYITPSGGVSLGRNPYPTVNPNGAPGSVAASFRGTTVFTENSAAQTGISPRALGCARCACD